MTNPPEVDAQEGRPGSSEGEQRRVRRRPIHGVLVALDAPSISDQPWVADAVDIGANGIGLVLPPELAVGTQVLLTFKLDELTEFSRLPATILHRDGLSGGARFEVWPMEDRLKLLEYLVRFYETVG